MDFHLFGPFEVWHEGTQLDPGDLQQRLVLVILLLHVNSTVTKKHLQDAVWQEKQPRSDLVTSYIARLKKVFGDSAEVVIDKTATGYVLRADENLIDTVRFTRLSDQARKNNDAKLFYD